MFRASFCNRILFIRVNSYEWGVIRNRAIKGAVVAEVMREALRMCMKYNERAHIRKGVLK